MNRADIALLAWIPISFFIMVDRNTVRAFSIAFILGMLFLPEADSVKIAILPKFGKPEAMTVGVMLGTLVFHPNLVFKFRPQFMDLFLVGALVCAIITSVYNNLGFYDGLASAFYRGTDVVLLIILGRIHLNTPERLREFLIYLVLGSMGYTLLALWEFRMSPQIHSKMYGYFQHVFIQFYRNGWWRPVVCFPHALDLGRFFAFCAFLAAYPLRQDLARRFPYGKWYFLAPLVGLLISMSYGPYLMFLVLVSLHFIPRRMRPLAYLMPAAALLWVTLIFVDIDILNPVVDILGLYNPERAASLQYRLDAFHDYSHVIREQLIIGHGSWGRGRIEGVATDSKLLIDMLSRGLMGAFCIYGWWLWTMWTAHRLAARTATMRFGNLANGIAGTFAICVTFAVIDAGLDPHIKIIGGAIVAIYPLALMSQQARTAVPALVRAPEPVVGLRPPRGQFSPRRTTGVQ